MNTASMAFARRACSVTVYFVLTACAAGALGQVELRGGEVWPGSITAIDVQGVWLVPETGGERIVISWDRVRAVPDASRVDASRFAPQSDAAWRARTRVQRGDVDGAEPILVELFKPYAGQAGATSAVVAGGLLVCRLERGALASAVEPYLAYVAAGGPRAAGPDSPERRDPPGWLPELDAQTGLCRALPPIWQDVPSVRAFASSIANSARAAGASRAGTFAAYYGAAALGEVGQAAEVPPPDPSDPGAVFLSEIVLSRLGDEPVRAEARRALAARLKERPEPWVEVWTRTAIGRSLLREAPSEDRRLGIVELLKVAAHFPDENPYLTGVALSQAAVALHDLGELGAAGDLARELLAMFPDHPSREWSAFRILITPDPKTHPTGPAQPVKRNS